MDQPQTYKQSIFYVEWMRGKLIFDKVEASIIDQVNLNTHYGSCNADMDGIYTFLGEWS
jgi:hypothetical protein